MIKLILGDCLEKMQELEDNSVDSIVTDPPYGLEFMGKKWDRIGDNSANFTNLDKPHESQKSFPMNKSRGRPISETDGFKQQQWHYQWAKEAIRVLKPGGYLLAFGGDRTEHRLKCAIEDAGFIIKGTIGWCYGSGFPKNHDISKAIDRLPKIFNKLSQFAKELKDKREKLEYTISQADQLITGGTTMYSFFEGRNFKGENYIYPPDKESYKAIKKYFGIEGWEEIVEDNLKEISKENGNFGYQKNQKRWKKERAIKIPTSSNAKQWEGWGNALKPALELICWAQKPTSEKNIASNVLKWGTGGINVDKCRIDGRERIEYGLKNSVRSQKNIYGKPTTSADFNSNKGRWPANLIHDGSEEIMEFFPETGVSSGGTVKAGKFKDKYNRFSGDNPGNSAGGLGDSGSAARFFKQVSYEQEDIDTQCLIYQAKANKADRTENGKVTNNHATVKPTPLLQYLCRLITPPDGIVLDPFMGSGTTGKAAIKEGFNFIGIEKEEEYLQIAQARIKEVKKSLGLLNYV